MITNQSGRRPDVLVTPDWVQEHLHDPRVRLVEVT
jgi:3-mercaptopyruvate sulfurtransferase SseA